jgi:hypothetical protein
VCPFIEDNVRQGFVENFKNLNPKSTRAKNHGHVEPKDLYHERVIILDRFRNFFWRNNKAKMKA